MNGKMYRALGLIALGITALSVSLAQPAPPPPGHPASSRRIYIQRPGGSYLGVGVAEVDAERAKALNLKEVRGVEITNVDEDSPAGKAGLKKGDVVLEYNGQRIEGSEQFVRVVRETPIDRQVRLLIWRNGGAQTLTATIGHRTGAYWHGDEGEDITVEIPPIPPMPPMPDFPEIQPLPDFPRGWNSAHSGMLGIESEALNPQLAEFFGVKEGVLVRSVMRNSAAEKAGMRAGDVIVKVDGEAVTGTRGIASALRAARSKKNFPVVVMRDKKELTLTVTLESAGGGGTREMRAMSA